MTRRARVRRLEEQLTPAPAVTVDAWCYPDGEPCDPPAWVRRRVEEQATGAWQWAAWCEESGCVVLLAADDTLQVVEL